MSLADGISKQLKRQGSKRHNTITEHLAITTSTIGKIKRCNVNCDMPKKTHLPIGRNVFKPCNVITWHMSKACASSEVKCLKNLIRGRENQITQLVIFLLQLNVPVTPVIGQNRSLC